MHQLTEGKISNKDIAEWFGITPNSFSKNKAKKLEELKSFAKYHLDDKNHIVIDQVYNDTYVKNCGETYQRVRDKVDEVWDLSGLDSCKRVGDEIYNILSKEDENFSLQSSTVYNYTIKGRNELYGKPFIGEGSRGKCIYLWCKRDKESGEYSLLNEEEQKIKQNLQIKYFGDATEKQIMVKAMVEAGEITKEEAWGVLEEMTKMNTGNFLGFLSELQSALGGCQVVRGTLVERKVEEICAWEE